MPFRLKTALAFLILLSVQPLFAEPETSDDEAVRQGLAHIYNLEYKEARAVFDGVMKKDPANPLGPYGITMVDWWELTNEYDEHHPELEKKFLLAVDETIQLAQAKAKNDPDGVARLCWGGALGLRGRWNAITGHWYKAYHDGKTAFHLQQAALKDNPDLHDAELGLGVFHYYTATLPKAVKFLARFVFGESSREEGLKQIHSAAEKSRYSRTAAKLFLVGIYTNTEKKPAEALRITKGLRQEYPKSSFFHFLEMLVLEAGGDWKTLRAESENFGALCAQKAPSYGDAYVHRGLLELTNSYLLEGDLAKALKGYNDILARYPLADRWITLTYMNRGKTYDLMGQRENALKDYGSVLKRRDVWQLHDLAEKYIDKPYKQDASPSHG